MKKFTQKISLYYMYRKLVTNLPVLDHPTIDSPLTSLPKLVSKVAVV